VTAVDLRPLETARAAVGLLERRVDGDEHAGPVVVETRLVVRTSTLRRAGTPGDGPYAVTGE
jgi:hypothetical protein